METSVISVLNTEGADPITAFLTRDWAALGGWSLFLGLCLLVVTGSFREWWVPGARHRRVEEAAMLASKANEALIKQNGDLLTANQITKYFFEETTPKRGEARSETVQET